MEPLDPIVSDDPDDLHEEVADLDDTVTSDPDDRGEHVGLYDDHDAYNDDI